MKLWEKLTIFLLLFLCFWFAAQQAVVQLREDRYKEEQAKMEQERSGKLFNGSVHGEEWKLADKISLLSGERAAEICDDCKEVASLGASVIVLITDEYDEELGKEGYLRAYYERHVGRGDNNDGAILGVIKTKDGYEAYTYVFGARITPVIDGWRYTDGLFDTFPENTDPMVPILYLLDNAHGIFVKANDRYDKLWE